MTRCEVCGKEIRYDGQRRQWYHHLVSDCPGAASGLADDNSHIQPATTPPDFTEQASKLVESCFTSNEVTGGCGYNGSELKQKVASFAAEAATQGQIVGIERAAQMCSDYGEEWGHQQHDEVLKAAGLELAGDIRALSPDPDYLDRVRSEAATAALGQAARAMCSLCAQQVPTRLIEGSMRLWHWKDGGEPHPCEAAAIQRLKI